MRLTTDVEHVSEPQVHHGLGLLGRQRGRLTCRMRFMAPRRALEDLQDEPALMQPVMDTVGAQIVLDAHVSGVPRLHRARARAKCTQGLQRYVHVSVRTWGGFFRKQRSSTGRPLASGLMPKPSRHIPL